MTSDSPHISRAEFCSGEIFFQMANDNTNPRSTQNFIEHVVAAKRVADAELERQRKVFMFGDAEEQLGCEGAASNFSAKRGPEQLRTLTLKGAATALENARRGGDGTLNIHPGADPDKDYAAALNFMAMGLSHLEEGLPNGQMERVQLAYASMARGLMILGEFLKERGAV